MAPNENLYDLINLYLYGELSAEEQAQFEAEMARSPELAEAVARERRFLELLNRRPQQEVSEALLVECRHDLLRTIYRAERLPPVWSGWREWFGGKLSGGRFAYAPVALALVAVGFWGGRATREAAVPPPAEAAVSLQTPVVAMPAAITDIHSVDLDPRDGEVRIIFEERRTITGRPSDPSIRNLLVSTVQNSNSGVRLDSVEALRQRSGDRIIRKALINALLGDDNPGVRLKALEALAPRRADPEVHAALIQALTRDQNPGVRVQTIEMLTERPNRKLVGVLQELIRSEPNNYVRLRCRRALHELDASVDLY